VLKLSDSNAGRLLLDEAGDVLPAAEVLFLAIAKALHLAIAGGRLLGLVLSPDPDDEGNGLPLK
jgi:hypothetical protein